MSSFPNSPRLLKGGIVLIDPASARVLRLIALQYNPDTFTRTLTVNSVSAMAATLQFTMQAALQRWLGDLIDVLRLEVSSDDATLAMALDYRIRRDGELRNDTFTTDMRHE